MTWTNDQLLLSIVWTPPGAQLNLRAVKLHLCNLPLWGLAENCAPQVISSSQEITGELTLNGLFSTFQKMKEKVKQPLGLRKNWKLVPPVKKISYFLLTEIENSFLTEVKQRNELKKTSTGVWL